MNLLLFRHLWGHDLPWTQAFAAIAAGGYAGVEAVLPKPERADAFVDLLGKHGLQWIACAQTSGQTPAEHTDALRRQCETAKRLGARFVVAHAGRDAFTRGEVAALFAATLQIEEELGLPVAHETHRGRPLYDPWKALSLLDEFPTLRLTCDLSHWVCVAERLLDDSGHAADDAAGALLVRRAAEQAFHVHARVGYAQGPQVPDPRAAAYARELAAHERWWDAMWASQRRRGFAESTLCPEFGPPPYQQTDPATGRPLADVAAVVDWQADRQRRRFAAGFASS